MLARLRVSLPIGLATALVALFITRVVFPDPSTLVLEVVTVAGMLTVVVLSVRKQKSLGLRGRSREG